MPVSVKELLSDALVFPSKTSVPSTIRVGFHMNAEPAPLSVFLNFNIILLDVKTRSIEIVFNTHILFATATIFSSRIVSALVSKSIQLT